ncbi:hypothetical protein ACHAWF_003423 [Thalassiosira exigua]
MKSIAAILACCCCLALCLDGTTSYSTLSLPPPWMVPTHQWSATRPRTSLIAPSTAADLGVPLYMQNERQGLFRRAKNRLQTLVRPKTEPSKQKEPEEMWRVLFHDTPYLPGYVCKALAKAMPISKKAAFEVCLRAREEGAVTLTVCNKKQAEKYCGAILRQGLKATIEPLELE